MKIYNKINLIKPNFFQKLLNISPKGNFVLELQNLLAENEENISAIKIDDIEQLKNKYKVKNNFSINFCIPKKGRQNWKLSCNHR